MPTRTLRRPRPAHAALLEPLFEELYRRAQEGDGSARSSLRAWVERIEALRITCALREHRGNRSAAARALGIGRRTLYTKMERLGIGPTWSLSGGNGSAGQP